MPNVVIIPTYRERENIEELIKAISSLSVPFDLLIIDDNSPDGTAGIIKNLQPAYPN
ncbi:MAG: glycosyltransferase, partial [Firmicutes bacterium]|nr:glycosyltransferase [Bacillota bacterium]